MKLDIAVDAQRLWRTIEDSSQFGATPKGGVRRLSLSKEDRLVREWFRKICESAGCQVHVDALGSMFAVRRGRDPSRPCVGIGSHLDTQPTGGRFDGILGVCAAIEVIRSLNDAQIETEASICAINWTNEEGCRFAPAMMGSAVYSGLMPLADALGSRDENGVSIAQALEAVGLRQKDVGARIELGSFLELHIEQGPILEARQAAIGVVEGAYGLAWYNGTVQGFESHAGSTPMGLRRDALAALSEFVLAIEKSATDLAPAAVATVGEVRIENASRNVIPGNVHFTIDCRIADASNAKRLDGMIRSSLAEIASRRRVKIELKQILDKTATPFDRTLVGLVEETTRRLGYPMMKMTSGAGHDSCNLSTCVPTAMIFVPCKDGVSHNESEDATPRDCAAGANVLLHAALALANK